MYLESETMRELEQCLSLMVVELKIRSFIDSGFGPLLSIVANGIC